MTHLRIRNIGPLKDTGYIPITNIMLIIGEQSVGKSTFMKVLSFCRWIEKKVMLQKFDDIIVKGGFIKQLKEFHKLSDEYFKNGEPYVEYTSDVVSIIHKGLNTKFQPKETFFLSYLTWTASIKCHHTTPRSTVLWSFLRQIPFSQKRIH